MFGMKERIAGKVANPAGSPVRSVPERPDAGSRDEMPGNNVKTSRPWDGFILARLLNVPV
jgi:hypothetical protein